MGIVVGVVVGLGVAWSPETGGIKVGIEKKQLFAVLFIGISQQFKKINQAKKWKIWLVTCISNCFSRFYFYFC